MSSKDGQKNMDFDSVGLYQRGEHLDPVVGYSDSPLYHTMVK